MVSRFTELCIDCAEPRTLAEFWAGVLGWEVIDDGGAEIELRDPEERQASLLFARVPESKSVKNRLHIDVNPRDREQAEEVERVLALGATHADVGQTGEESWVVLADPEGNEFCILASRRP